MKASQVLRRAFYLLTNKKRFIARRLLIYFLILLLLFPFVVLNRKEIYSSLIVRHDDWYERDGANGIPVAEYGVQDNVYVGPQGTPRIVANAGFNYYAEMKKGNVTAREYFNNTVEWMVNRLEYSYVPTENGTLKTAHWYFDFAIWDLPRGWHQAMSDAKGMHLLALAYQEYGNASYIGMIDAVANSFLVPMEFGGNVYTLENGMTWYPEYVVSPHLDPSYSPPLILNGFLIGLYNLKEVSKILNDSKIEGIFNVGVVSAVARLPRYDSHYNWTLYHLDYPMKLASRSYHQIHIDMVEYLYESTNITIFKYYADKWKSYDGPPLITIEELLAPDFLFFGFLVGSTILVAVVTLDIIQYTVRKKLRNSK